VNSNLLRVLLMMFAYAVLITDAFAQCGSCNRDRDCVPCYGVTRAHLWMVEINDCVPCSCFCRAPNQWRIPAASELMDERRTASDNPNSVYVPELGAPLFFEMDDPTIDTIASINPSAGILVTLFSGKGPAQPGQLVREGEAFFRQGITTNGVRLLRDRSVSMNEREAERIDLPRGARIHIQWRIVEDKGRTVLHIVTDLVDAESAKLSSYYPGITLELRHQNGYIYNFVRWSVSP
jgi:hypothetical protein